MKRLRVFKEKPGVISEGPCWVALEPGYLYIADTLCGLVFQLVFERHHDRHLA